MMYVLVFALGVCLGALVVLGMLISGHFDEERRRF